MMNHDASPKTGKFALIFILAVIALLTAACGGDATGDSSSSTLAPQEAEDIEIDAPDANELYVVSEDTDAETLYQTFCAKCHGLEGLGDGPSSGSLHLTGGMTLTILQDRSDEEIMEIITYGKGVDMPPWGLILTLEQRELVLAYVRTLGE